MAARKIAERQPCNSDSDEPFHFVTDFVKHAANLAIDSLPQDHAQSSWFNEMDFLETGALAIEHHAAKEFRSERRVPGTIKRYFVFLLDLVTRMGEALGKLAVVC